MDDYTIYIPVLNRLIEDIQKKQDIYNDQLLSISQALEEKDDNTLKEALHEITEYNISQKISYQFLHLQNRLLAGLMYAKTTAAKEKKLLFDITISDYTCPCHCTDIELVDLVGILIDNAIDASHENDTIFITIDRMQDRFLFRIENPGPKADSAFLSKNLPPRLYNKGTLHRTWCRTVNPAKNDPKNIMVMSLSATQLIIISIIKRICVWKSIFDPIFLDALSAI